MKIDVLSSMSAVWVAPVCGVLYLCSRRTVNDAGPCGTPPRRAPRGPAGGLHPSTRGFATSGGDRGHLR